MSDLAKIEASHKQTQADLKQVGDQLKAYAEETQKQIKAAGETQGETRAKVDELLVKHGELSARLNEAEQKLVAGSSGNEPEQNLSIGQHTAAKLAENGISSNFKGKSRIEMPRSAITNAPGSGEGVVAPDRRPGIIALPQQRLTIRDLVAPGTTGSNLIQYVRETGFVNNARPVSEGAQKPYSDITFEQVNSPVQTIAHLFKASKQILDDSAALQSFIDARARYGLQIAEERQLLYGNGTGPNLHGIIPQAQAYAQPDGAATTNAQRIDRIRMAILQAFLAEFPATGIVLHPTDWANIELTKDGEGRYIIGNPQGSAMPMLWRLPVVETQAIEQDEFLTGAFGMAAQIYDRDTIEVLISTENDKDFETNMVTLRAEERLAFAVYRPESFVTGSLTGS